MPHRRRSEIDYVPATLHDIFIVRDIDDAGPNFFRVRLDIADYLLSRSSVKIVCALVKYVELRTPQEHTRKCKP